MAPEVVVPVEVEPVVLSEPVDSELEQTDSRSETDYPDLPVVVEPVAEKQTVGP